MFAMCAACGGTAAKPTAAVRPVALEPVVAAQGWYRSPTPCGQGPYEVDVPVADARWGQEVELRIATPRRIALYAVILADGIEVARGHGVYDRSGAVEGAADNARCVADVHERLAASRGGGGNGGESPGGSPGPGGTQLGAPVMPPATAKIVLVSDPSVEPASQEVLRFAWPAQQPHAQHVRIQLWSIDPNDLADVRFGVARVEWRPNVPEAAYEAYLAQVAARDAEAQRQAELAERNREAVELERARHDQVEAHVTVVVETDGQRAERLRLERERLERERLRLVDEERRRAIAAALEAERVARHEAFCASHAEDRDCWGAGGRRVHDELARHDRERASYCDATPEDARCWSSEAWDKRRVAFQKRVEIALAPPREPDGPPPAPLAEDMPPKLSLHAEWRAGYWQWTGTDWTWLGGMWRVPDSDIVAELTTTAPSEPPPLRVETVPAAPMRVLFWVPGFWQWGGTTWVWVAGSWQRPEAGATWRPAAWRARGKVHVLIPGQWVRT